MATYRYRCDGCGPFDAALPIGSARSQELCPACGGMARRVFTPPLLASTSPALARALRAQEASAWEPRIVREVPAARRPAVSPADPRHSRLPRP